MENEGLKYLPTHVDIDAVRDGLKIRKLDCIRGKARANFNVPGANATGRQIVNVRRKILNKLGV